MIKQVKKRIGHGLTEREVIYDQADADDPEAVRKLMGELKQSLDDPFEGIARLGEFAKADFDRWQADNPGQFPVRETEPWHLLMIYRFTREVSSHIDDGNAAWAAALAYKVGMMASAVDIESRWGKDAFRGRKFVENAGHGRKADDADRAALVESILMERQKGVRDATRVAAVRRPNWGKPGTFKEAYYKKVSKTAE